MTDDIVTNLRDRRFDGQLMMRESAAQRIEELQDTITKIQYTNLRRDMNIENRTKEIERLCKGESK
jgi:hypothetical protein